MSKPDLRLFFVPAVLIISLLSLNSCRKSNIAATVPEINYEEKFFTVPAGVNPVVLRVINKIKDQNNKYHFVNNFVKKHGFPKWEHAEVKPGIRRGGNSVYYREASTADTLVFIPIANEVMLKIKDVLACDVGGTDVAIKIINDYTYKYYGYELHPDGTANAADIAKMFMNYEYKVYQKKIFEIKDVELAKKLFGDEWETKLKHLIL